MQGCLLDPASPVTVPVGVCLHTLTLATGSTFIPYASPTWSGPHARVLLATTGDHSVDQHLLWTGGRGPCSLHSQEVGGGQ